MGYEELTVHAIQRKDAETFSNRFQVFSSKSDRDQTLTYIRDTQDALILNNLEPVVLQIFVKTEESNQLWLNFDDLGV